MRVVRLINVDLIRDVIANPRVWVYNDHAPDRATWVPDVVNQTWLALLAGDPESLRGVVVAQKRSSIEANVRIAFKPEHWGSPDNVALGRLAVRWLYDQGMYKLTGVIPDTNKAALRLAQRVGFRREGINRKSIRIDGEWRDQMYVGMFLE